MPVIRIQNSSACTVLRARLAEEIEERIALLDALDGDPDFEPGGDDEPSLGWTRTMGVGNGHDLEVYDSEVMDGAYRAYGGDGAQNI